MFEERIFYSEKRQGEFLKYLYFKDGIGEDLPLIVHLHGSGSRGNELSQMGIAGPLAEITNGRRLGAVFVAPQCHCDKWFELFDVLLEFIDTMRNSEGIDKTRVYLTGISMGAYGAWETAMSRPDWFAALVAVCGGGMYWNAGKLKDLPIWAFHGALDNVVYPEESIKMVSAVNRNGGNAKITIYPHTDHSAWVPAFQEDEMWNWMFSQKRSD